MIPHETSPAGSVGFGNARPEAERPPSLTVNSLVRLTADLGGAAAGMVAAIISARVLGPSGKGTASTLLYLAGLSMLVGTFGMGEAAIVAIGRGRRSLQEALSATLPVVGLISTFVAIILLAYSAFQFQDDWRVARTAVFITAASVPLASVGNVIAHIFNSEERFVLTSLATLTTSLVTTASLYMFLAVWHLSITGVALASMSGSIVGVAILLLVLRRHRISLRPRWDASYLPEALRFGALLQLSYVFAAVSNRFDLVLVYSLAGSESAGSYSVALTLGLLSAYASIAMASTSFPRIARLGEADKVRLTGQVFRVGIATSILVNVALLAMIPVALPQVFGTDYRSAIVPAILLLPGGSFWSGQYILSRAMAARGNARLQVASFGGSLGVMISLDLLLIPHLSVVGAAASASLSSALGLTVCIWAWRRTWLDTRDALRFLVPGVADFRAILTLPSRLRGRGWSAGSSGVS